MRRVDVLIVGAGPAGLCAGLALQHQGLSLLACEQRRLPADKACGEGIMPTGLEDLRELGVELPGAFPFTGISYHTPAGKCRSADFREGPGAGLRRLELSQALREQAHFEILEQTRVRLIERGPAGVLCQVGEERVLARVVLGADGLGSGVRRWAGLEGTPARRRRWGARRHYAVAPWSSRVEVYWSQGCEAYLTPCGAQLVGVAMLWEPQGAAGGVEGLWDRLLGSFPELKARLVGPAASSVALLGPLERRARAQVGPGIVLLGDAAGYLDAITGEGISLATAQALELGRLLPGALARHPGLLPPLLAYQARYRRLVLPYYALTQLALCMSRRPWLLEKAVDWVDERGFQRLLSANMGRF